MIRPKMRPAHLRRKGSNERPSLWPQRIIADASCLEVLQFLDISYPKPMRLESIEEQGREVSRNKYKQPDR